MSGNTSLSQVLELEKGCKDWFAYETTILCSCVLQERLNKAVIYFFGSSSINYLR